jgi:hypothetical protein
MVHVWQGGAPWGGGVIRQCSMRLLSRSGTRFDLAAKSICIMIALLDYGSDPRTLYRLLGPQVLLSQ